MKNGTVQSRVKINEGEQYIVNIVPLGQPCFAMGSPVFLAQILRAFFTVSHGSVDMTFFLARSAANEGTCNWELCRQHCRLSICENWLSWTKDPNNHSDSETGTLSRTVRFDYNF